MKFYHLFLLSAAAAALTIQSCGNKTTQTEDTGEASASEATASAVTVINNDEEIPTSNDKLTVLDFNATWCGPCRQFAPNFESIAEKYSDKALFYSVDVDNNPTLAARYGIQSIPTVIYIQPDGTTTSTMGYMDAPAFEAEVISRLTP